MEVPHRYTGAPNLDRRGGWGHGGTAQVHRCPEPPVMATGSPLRRRRPVLPIRGAPWSALRVASDTTYDPAMADVSHTNVDTVRRAFNAMASGDMATVLEIYSPDLAYYGGDQLGRFRSFGSRDEFFGMVMEAMALNSRFENELVDAFAVGDSLVMAHVRGHRAPASGGEPMTFDYVMALRLENGVVTHANDLIDADAERYFSSLG
jgi:ketosteroid isomerase-like protein